MPNQTPPPSVAELDEALGDGYEVLDLIGQGGMGSVFKARQPRLHRLVAVKILPPGPPEAAQRIHEEARHLARLSHPNIVTVYEAGSTPDGQLYIIMEHVQGADLKLLIQTGRLEPRHAFAWISQISAALTYAHARGMVHLDIKPANILVDSSGSVKVADFGLAQILQPGTPFAPRRPEGTPDFVAPEVLRRSGQADHRADIYSLGALIYQMLTGKTPRGLWEAPSALVPGLDPRLDALVERALEADPAKRYQSMRDLEADLHEITFSTPDGLGAMPALSPGRLTRRLGAVFAAMLAAQLVGSTFNVWYNLNHLRPLFESAPGEWTAFLKAIQVWNATAYPPLVACWGYLVFSLRRMPQTSQAAKRRLLNLPWWALGIAALGWAGTVPGVLVQMDHAPGMFYFHLPISVSIAAAIALALGFLSVDLLCQNLLYTHFFAWNERLWKIPGTVRLSLTGRGLFLTIASSVCPVLAMLLLVLGSTDNPRVHWFAVAVSVVCILFGLGGVWLFSKLVILPVNYLREAAQRIGDGDLDARVRILRADELGVLGHEFNRMTTGLRERRHILQMLGQTVRRQVADELLQGAAVADSPPATAPGKPEA